jgi:uncharacterized protein (DUF1684 family)
MQRTLSSFLMIALCSLMLVQCDPSTQKTDSKSYKEKIQQWRSSRMKNLKAPDGWLNLVGLEWLKQGKNTIGSDSSNDVVFPEKAPAKVGELFLEEGTIRFDPAKEAVIKHNNKVVNKRINLQSDASGEPTVLEHGSFRWFVIKRGDQFAIRLRDLESPLLEKLDSIPAFPVEPEWKIKASFIPHNPPKTIEMPNVLGNTNEAKSPGLLRFTYQGKQYTLHPTGSKESMFLVFGDESNAEETYGGGRFLVVPGPGEDNTTWIDFNKAYNPPCSFTPYATCPMPPRENILPFKVLAGEKAPGLDVPHGH